MILLCGHPPQPTLTSGFRQPTRIGSITSGLETSKQDQNDIPSIACGGPETTIDTRLFRTRHITRADHNALVEHPDVQLGSRNLRYVEQHVRECASPGNGIGAAGSAPRIAA